MDRSVESDDLVSARDSLLKGSALLRQRSVAAGMLDDLGHRVATRYPLPVAYRWRAALAARGGPEDLRPVLHANEVLHAYLGIMAIISARDAGVQLPALVDIQKRLSRRGPGISLGDWRALVQQFAELKAVKKLPGTHAFVEVRDFMADRMVVEASDRLSVMRNDFSHLREPGPAERREALDGAWHDVQTLYAAAGFVTEYPLIRVVTTRWDTYEGTNMIEFRQLAGDNPVVPLQDMEVADSAVEAGSLYFVDSRNGLHLLRPLVIGEECPKCGHWSTFLPDKWNDSGIVEYKSFEHGHSLEPEGVERGLVEIGLFDGLAFG